MEAVVEERLSFCERAVALCLTAEPEKETMLFVLIRSRVGKRKPQVTESYESVQCPENGHWPRLHSCRVLSWRLSREAAPWSAAERAPQAEQWGKTMAGEVPGDRAKGAQSGLDKLHVKQEGRVQGATFKRIS